MKWIYLSPHFDDAVLSCGGIIWEQTNKGELVEIWTICSEDPPDEGLSPIARGLHDRWEIDQNTSISRREEDKTACLILNCGYKYLNLPDVIYRRNPLNNKPIIIKEEDLFKPLRLEESYLLISLAKEIEKELPHKSYLISPLGVGGHVDHRLTRCAAEAQSIPLRYYIEYPYCRDENANVNKLINRTWRKEKTHISNAGLFAWEKAISAYTSQISTFWDDTDAMESEVDALWLNNDKSGFLLNATPHL